jgi:hypothetical protein
LDVARALLSEKAEKTEARAFVERSNANDHAAVDKPLDSLAQRGVAVDILVLNVARFAIDIPRPQFEYVLERPKDGLSKAAGTLAIQYVAQDANPDELQALSYDPSLAYRKTDSRVVEMSGNYAVWGGEQGGAISAWLFCPGRPGMLTSWQW